VLNWLVAVLNWLVAVHCIIFLADGRELWEWLNASIVLADSCNVLADSCVILQMASSGFSRLLYDVG
jgi:hypothetical protein